VDVAPDVVSNSWQSGDVVGHVLRGVRWVVFEPVPYHRHPPLADSPSHALVFSGPEIASTGVSTSRALGLTLVEETGRTIMDAPTMAEDRYPCCGR
jgi:hypothetical protein